jgi:hypothetical protein
MNKKTKSMKNSLKNIKSITFMKVVNPKITSSRTPKNGTGQN